MMTVLVTGSDGFIGRNLREALQRLEDVRILCFDVSDDPATLPDLLAQADIIFHLAGVNRPRHVEEFQTGNAGLTAQIVETLTNLGKTVPLVVSSSTQAEQDNPYGISKRQAEDAVFAYGRTTGAAVYVYRLTNVFGKWSRPNYNSVVSTFCHNIAHGIDITISNPANVVELVYIDDIISHFMRILQGDMEPSDRCLSVGPVYRTTLGELADRIYQLHDIRTSLVIPDLADDFTRKLHATYLSYLDRNDFSHGLDIKTDPRGELAELIKSAHFGQMFVSRTHAGITRGNHYHNTKIEKFCVLQGDAVIRFRHVFLDDVIEYRVTGTRWEVVDIPPGYTHHIENIGTGEMITLFWANQIFDPAAPDTYYREVQCEKD